MSSFMQKPTFDGFGKPAKIGTLCHFFVISNGFNNLPISWKKSKINCNFNIFMRRNTEMLSLNAMDLVIKPNYTSATTVHTPRKVLFSATEFFFNFLYHILS